MQSHHRFMPCLPGCRRRAWRNNTRAVILTSRLQRACDGYRTDGRGTGRAANTSRRRPDGSRPLPQARASVATYAILAAVLLQAPIGRADEGSAPPVPKGFSSRAAVETALFSGELALIDAAIPVPPAVRRRSDITYGRVGDRALQLDLYAPTKIEQPAVAVILIHGGGWRSGRRQMYHYYGVRLAERGYVAATISYRLAGEAVFPAAVQDVKCAVRWMRARAAALHVDPHRIAAMGGSAGGHLALMAAYADDPALEGDGGHADVSSRVQAVISLYGPTDLTTPVARGNGMVRDFMGVPYQRDHERYAHASPMHHLSDDDPPTLLLHGTLDGLVSISQSDALAARLGELGVPVGYTRYEGWPHVMDAARVVNDHCLWSIDRFLQTHLSRRPAGRAEP